MPLIGPDPEDYDYHDVDNRYNPKHPVREGITMGICLVVIAALVLWLLSKVV